VPTFRDQVALITGAASGIGRGLALALAAEGARVAALDLRPEGLDSLAAELAGKPLACAAADVTDADALQKAVAGLEEALGPTDLLIASAGIGRETSVQDFNPRDIAEQVQVNLIGVANSIAAVLPGMRRRNTGHLSALSSLASYRGLPRMAGYCASKAGVNALLDALRVELRGTGLAVTTVCPGWVRTPLTAQVDLPGVRMLDCDEAVRRILAALRPRKAFVAFPARGVWPVRLMRYLPRPIGDWMAHRYLLRSRKE
jgi:NAD(P)-dependent dehydrogenase (short-subunit alcohol dehydrogenase family)